MRSVAFPETVSCETTGITILRQLNLSTDKAWKWGGIAFLVLFCVAFNWLSIVGLSRVYIERNVGTSRTKEVDDEEAVIAAQHEHKLQLEAAAAAAVTNSNRRGAGGAAAGTAVTADESAAAAGGGVVVLNHAPTTIGGSDGTSTKEQGGISRGDAVAVEVRATGI